MKKQYTMSGLFLAGWCALSCLAMAAGPVELSIDCARETGTIRPLHGVNSGPLQSGETLDLSAYFRAAQIPFTRLHDCHWPNSDVVDIHAIFPDFKADPSLPESYTFTRTDDYIQSIVDAGVGIVFRLGESIEHSKRKYYVHPPADPQKWAAVCVGIVRHYNEGWAKGFHHNIRYWEIWNEPENRPAMWTGDDQQYLEMYRLAAKAIRAQCPKALVGGPAAGYAGKMVGEAMEPAPLVDKLFEMCKRESVPLDFFSWHTYTNDPQDLARRARAVRRMLDERGFQKTENHLNEWNYLPDNNWDPMLTKDGKARQRWFDRIGGAEGAAFTAASLALLQNTPLDVSNFYSADIQGFGTFTACGVPRKNFYALKAFNMLWHTPGRLAVEGTLPAGLAAAAGIDRKAQRVTILASNYAADVQTLRLGLAGLPWTGPTARQTLRLDAERDLEEGTGDGGLGTESKLPLEVQLPRSSVVVITLRPTEVVGKVNPR